MQNSQNETSLDLNLHRKLSYCTCIPPPLNFRYTLISVATPLPLNFPNVSDAHE